MPETENFLSLSLLWNVNYIKASKCKKADQYNSFLCLWRQIIINIHWNHTTLFTSLSFLSTNIHCAFIPSRATLKLFLLNYFIVVQLKLSAFSPHHSPPTPTNLTFLPWFHPPTWFCPCVLYSSSWKPFPPLSPPLSPLAIVRLFLISMSPVIFGCFFLLIMLSFCLLCSS